MTASDANAQTNHLLVEGVPVRDPSPYDPLATPGYNLGSFDGYALSVTVSDGKLSIEGASDAVDPKLCFVEIGPKDGVIDAATQARLATFVTQATAQTATGRPDNVKPLRIVALHGDYVDERLVERTRHGTGPYAITTTRYLHHNRQYSVIAITNEAGAVTERYRYDPFGTRTVLAPDGITVRNAAIEDTDTGFTGRDLDQDSGLMYFRHRWYSPKLGRFVNRDPAGYVDGLSLYAGYFAPNGVDPTGLIDQWHHLISQLGQGIDSKTKALLSRLDVDVNIDAKEYGLILDDKIHAKLESAGWWKEWKLWFDTTPECNITKDSIEAKLRAMKDNIKYKDLLNTGKDALVDYSEWKNLKKVGVKGLKGMSSVTVGVALSALLATANFADKEKYLELAQAVKGYKEGSNDDTGALAVLLQAGGLGQMEILIFMKAIAP
jgi:RHS repeat-associated protein